MMLIDTHCHLDTFTDIDSILDQAQACSVENVVAVSQDPESMRMVLDIRRQRANSVWIGLGLHPTWIIQNENDFWDEDDPYSPIDIGDTLTNVQFTDMFGNPVKLSGWYESKL